MMQPEGYGSIPMDLHISQQGYHPYYRKGHDDAPGPPIVQTRILEMRKEKSRDAARSRRGKENYEFYELAKMLPLPGAITTQLDKASIIRLTISFLKLKEFTAHGDPPWRKEGPSLKSGSLRSRSMSSVAIDLFEQHQATHILQSLDGFAFALGADGRFLYISETVSIYLGLSQVEMTGSSIFDYIHQQDQSELADLIGINMCPSPSAASPPASVASDDGSSSNPGPATPTGFDRPPPTMQLPNNSPSQSLQRSFCVRMKSTLTKRGCHFKSSGYRVVLVLSHLRPQYNFSQSSRKQAPSVMGLVAIAIALPPPSVNELRLESDMFVTRLTFDFRVSHCEPRVSELLDYTAEEITGSSMYTLCHGMDVEKLRKCHIDLLQKGQVMSGYYRLMNKNGGFTWLQSCATVICNSKNTEEETIICVNYVLSSVEYQHCVMDYCQQATTRDLRNDDPSSSERGTSPDKEGGGRDNPAPPPPNSSDVDPERASSRPDEGSSAAEEYGGDTSELDVEGSKRDYLQRQTEKPNQSPKFYNGSFPGGAGTKREPSEERAAEPRPRKRPKPPSSDAPSPRSSSPPPLPTYEDLRSPAADKVSRPWTRSPLSAVEDVMNRHLPPPLPATTLLRQIYVSRESVIRRGDGPLPTPPDNAPYEPAGYAAYLDNCSAMTPPSSVSPRDSFTEAAAAAAAAAAMPHMRHYVDPLPLKPLFDPVYQPPEQTLYHHPSSFHLYHPPPGAPKAALANGAASWFCQPHS